ncbi:MAG: hypothetical protein ACTSQZ_00340 [Candidatus Thorarchaeota archaeon]
MNDYKKDFSWKGVVILLVILIAVSIIAFVLSSIESFLAGVFVVFIGLVLSFFRDDMKRFLGLTTKTEDSQPIVIDEDDHIRKLEKTITKGREKVEKTVSKFEAAEKSDKQQKMAREIVERTTALIATIDQAKSYAIQKREMNLQQHYAEISEEIRGIRERYQNISLEKNTE